MKLYRAVFLEEMFEELVKLNVGIDNVCIQHLNEHLEDLLMQYGERFARDNSSMIQAGDSYRKLVQRMNKYARKRGSDSISEGDLVASIQECGLIYICQPPEDVT